MKTYFFSFMRLCSKITIMEVDTTVIYIAAVFFKKEAIIIATHGQKTLHLQLIKVVFSGV